MQLETGASSARVKPDWAELSGYDKIALVTIRAIVKNQGAIIPLDVPNRGTFPFLDDEDIIEVPCRVDANGPQPQVVAPIPDHPRELMTHGEGLRTRNGACGADWRPSDAGRSPGTESTRASERCR